MHIMKRGLLPVLVIWALSATAQNNNIFSGGDGGGWAYSSFIKSANNIFAGGMDDGWTFNSFSQPGNNIFSGGIDDGWSSSYKPSGTLPISILDFMVQKLDEKIVFIKWSATQDDNTNNFEIQRSYEALSFISVGSVPAHVSSGLSKDYSFLDHNPHKGLNFYRLKIIKKDGSFFYTPVRSVNFYDNRNKIAVIYPNPTRGKITAVLPKEVYGEKVVINVIDSKGMIVHQSKILSATAIAIEDLTRFSRGSYIIQVSSKAYNSVSVCTLY
jgi:hypothetical protein